MTKTKNTNNFFPFIIFFIILFFSSTIFLSIPVLFNYKSIESEIEKKFYSEFNISIKITDKIKYQFIPQPHLLITKANLNLNNQDPNSSIIKTENLKVFISPKHLYSKKNLKINKLEIQDTNFMLKLNDIINFRNHLYDKINKTILIKKSKLFYLDEDGNTIFISPIKKFTYLINDIDNFKKLKINGNIFDIDYQSLWKKYFTEDISTQSEIKFKNPNVLLKNKFKFENNSKFSGKSKISFLNEIIEIDYFLNGDKIKIESPNPKQKIKIFSNIELSPFYFESDIIFIRKKLNFLIDDFLYFFLSIKPEFLGNLNGNLSINLENIDNEIFEKGKIKISINENSVNLNEASFKFKEYGLLKSKISYIEKEGDLIFTTENILEIKNTKKFAKKFQINPKKIKKIDKILFNLNKNIATGKISIFEIQIIGEESKKDLNNIHNINNIQGLKSLLKSILST